MPYAHGLRQEDVFQAASEIFASGKNPTQATVRAKLGRGSFSTISKYLLDWRENQPEALITRLPHVGDIPEDIQQALRRFYGLIKAQVETLAVDEQVTLLEKENDYLRLQLADADQSKSELVGLRFAYQQTITRLEELTRENERLVKWVPQVDQIEQLTQERDRLLVEVQSLQAAAVAKPNPTESSPAANKSRSSAAKTKQPRKSSPKAAPDQAASTWEQRVNATIQEL